MRVLVGLIVAATALAVTGAGAAKVPPSGIDVCGQTGCTTVLPPDAERIFISLSGSRAEPAAPAPSFLLRWRWPNQPEQTVWWVPRSGTVLRAGGWISLSVASEAVLERAAVGLRPFPAPTLTRVVVGGRVAENPQSYLRLLRGGELVATFDGARGFVGVRLTSLEPSPWTNGSAWVMVSKASSFVWRDVWVYRVPKELAARARQALSLTPFFRAG